VSFAILYADELRGFLKSRVMLILWIGMPVVALVVHALQPDLQGQMPLAVFSTLLVSAVSSTIAAVMLSVGIIHERLRGVYALFLVRPVRRSSIVLSKYLAVVSCVAVAAALTIAVGWAWDALAGRAGGAAAAAAIGTSAATGLSTIAITSAAGLLIGIAAPSVLVGVILVIYGANQVSALGFVPVLLKLEPAWAFSLGIGAALAAALLAVSVVLFERKQF
jgi:ABC-2 type transport system permease protein